MILQEILDDADLRCPNSLTTAQKVNWIQQWQNRLYRKYNVPDVVEKFSTAPNVYFYPLPSDCDESQIRMLTVDGVKYDYRELNDEDTGDPYWTVVDGQLFLSSVNATLAKDCLIYYAPSFQPVSTTDTATTIGLTETPTFPKDYHELLVMGLCIKIAQSQKDVALVNNFQADFNELAMEAEIELGLRFEVSPTENVMPWTR